MKKKLKFFEKKMIDRSEHLRFGFRILIFPKSILNFEPVSHSVCRTSKLRILVTASLRLISWNKHNFIRRHSILPQVDGLKHLTNIPSCNFVCDHMQHANKSRRQTRYKCRTPLLSGLPYVIWLTHHH